MQHDYSMAERILRAVENIIDSDEYLKEFTIIPTEENVKNKSPVLYEDHNIGLESWCIKHVYRYVYEDLFKVRKSLRDNRLPSCKMENINHLLIGALLINPDVSTFWNMKRELVEYNILVEEKELRFSKLVLSHKSKSNEAFGYRRWILKRLLQKINEDNDEDEDLILLILLNTELAVCEMAANKAPNNYHAWTHRIWVVNNLAQKNGDTFEFDELDFSLKWVFTHVSEYTGFHYRQFLHKRVKENTTTHILHTKLYYHFKNLLNLTNNSDYKKILIDLLGIQDFHKEVNELSIINYLAGLIFDLCFLLEKLNNSYPGHETFWYHRRFLIYHLMQLAYEYHGLNFKPVSFIDDSCICDANNINIVQADDLKSDETQAKVLKYEPNKIESSYLYIFIVKNERKFINNNMNTSDLFVAGYVKNYEKWLKNLLNIHTV